MTLAWLKILSMLHINFVYLQDMKTNLFIRVVQSHLLNNLKNGNQSLPLAKQNNWHNNKSRGDYQGGSCSLNSTPMLYSRDQFVVGESNPTQTVTQQSLTNTPGDGSVNIYSGVGVRAPSPSSISSLTSGRRLEWDSGADVGYIQQQHDVGTCGELSTIERIALVRGCSAALNVRMDPEGTTSSVVPQPTLQTLNALGATQTNNVKYQMKPPMAESTLLERENTEGEAPSSLTGTESESEITPILRQQNSQALANFLMNETKEFFESRPGIQNVEGSNPNSSSHIFIPEKEPFILLTGKHSSSLTNLSVCQQHVEEQPNALQRSQSHCSLLDKQGNAKDLINIHIHHLNRHNKQCSASSSSIATVVHNQHSKSSRTSNKLIQATTAPFKHSVGTQVSDNITKQSYASQITNINEIMKCKSSSVLKQKKNVAIKQRRKPDEASNHYLAPVSANITDDTDEIVKKDRHATEPHSSCTGAHKRKHNIAGSQPSCGSTNQVNTHSNNADSEKKHAESGSKSESQAQLISSTSNDLVPKTSVKVVEQLYSTLESVASSTQTAASWFMTDVQGTTGASNLRQESGVVGSAHSFEYLPGHMYENKSLAENSSPQEQVHTTCTDDSSSSFTSRSSSHGIANHDKATKEKFWGSSVSSSLSRDLERGIQQLRDLLDTKQFDSDLKRKLIRRVVNRLVNSNYADDEVPELNLHQGMTSQQGYVRECISVGSPQDGPPSGVVKSQEVKSGSVSSTLFTPHRGKKPYTDLSTVEKDAPSETSSSLLESMAPEKTHCGDGCVETSSDMYVTPKDRQHHWRHSLTRSEREFELRRGQKGLVGTVSCRVTTIHTDRTVLRSRWDCVVSLPFTLIGLSSGLAGTVSCRVVSLPFTLIGLCSGLAGTVSCHVATIHTNRTVLRSRWDCVVSLGLCRVMSLPFTLIGLCSGLAGTVSCRVVSLPFTLIGLCSGLAGTVSCHVATIHTNRTVLRSRWDCVVSCRVTTIHTDRTVLRSRWDCVVSLPFTMIGLCWDCVVSLPFTLIGLYAVRAVTVSLLEKQQMDNSNARNQSRHKSATSVFTIMKVARNATHSSRSVTSITETEEAPFNDKEGRRIHLRRQFESRFGVRQIHSKPLLSHPPTAHTSRSLKPNSIPKDKENSPPTNSSKEWSSHHYLCDQDKRHMSTQFPSFCENICLQSKSVRNGSEIESSNKRDVCFQVPSDDRLDGTGQFRDQIVNVLRKHSVCIQVPSEHEVLSEKSSARRHQKQDQLKSVNNICTEKYRHAASQVSDPNILQNVCNVSTQVSSAHTSARTQTRPTEQRSRSCKESSTQTHTLIITPRSSGHTSTLESISEGILDSTRGKDHRETSNYAPQPFDSGRDTPMCCCECRKVLKELLVENKKHVRRKEEQPNKHLPDSTGLKKCFNCGIQPVSGIGVKDMRQNVEFSSNSSSSMVSKLIDKESRPAKAPHFTERKTVATETVDTTAVQTSSSVRAMPVIRPHWFSPENSDGRLSKRCPCCFSLEEDLPRQNKKEPKTKISLGGHCHLEDTSPVRSTSDTHPTVGYDGPFNPPTKNVSKPPIGYILTVESSPSLLVSEEEDMMRKMSLEEIKIKIPSRRPFVHTKEGSRGSSSVSSKKSISETTSEKKHPKERKLNNTKTSGKKLTLQEYLMMNRPDFVNTAEHRRRCLDQLAFLRELRNKSRQKLLASAVSFINTDSSTGAPSTANLPPPPLSVKRVFSQHTMRQQTERKYRQLPEVQNKKVERKRKEDYRTNRLMAEIFTRVDSRGSYPHLHGGRVENPLGKTTLSSPDRDLNPDLLAIDSLAYCESDALDHATTKAEYSIIISIDTSYVPDLRMNPISVAKIVDNNNKVTFEKDRTTIKDINGDIKVGLWSGPGSR
uniref:ALMS motif domain-containing protein n=1 Tax=Timema bartmani TaxID=61472 RepID=A0A7R9I6J6_9NEOP|nr:unnamed protein product [Timema bartmani]